MPPVAQTTTNAGQLQGDASRRNFFSQLAALAIGSLVVLVPLISGVVVLLDPLRRKGAAARGIRVASLEALPADGKPHRFAVVATTQDDAWTRFRNKPIGAVHLVRQPQSDEVLALCATCPHAGCLVPFNGEANCFKCPCHNSTFDVTGARLNAAASPSPRDMDTLVCQVRDGAVWVEFQNFQTGIAEKKPKA